MHDIISALTVFLAVTHFTHLLGVPFFESHTHYLHARSFTLVCTHLHTCIQPFYAFNHPSASLGYLDSELALPRLHCTFMRVKALPSSKKLNRGFPTLSSRITLCNSKRQFPICPQSCIDAFAGLKPLLTRTAHCIVLVLSRPIWIMIYVVFVLFHPTNSQDFFLCSSGS